ncbi:hypothetical protein [Dactylosporangium sp. NPDC051541]|uniref:hypothetical protein n=1 Tax=Dactylosporangium sp. NPDC051541 TaxID=3363977 RepID=UPI003796F272
MMLPRLVTATPVADVRDITALPDGGWLVIEPAAAVVLSAQLQPVHRIALPELEDDFSADFDGHTLVVGDKTQVVALGTDGEVRWRHGTGLLELHLATDCLWVTRDDLLAAVDIGTGRMLAATDVEDPMLTGRDLIVSRFEDSPLRPWLAGGRITLQPLGGGYVIATGTRGYLATGWDEPDVTWHDLATGTQLAGRRIEEPVDGCALISDDYAVINDDLVAIRTLRPVGPLDVPVRALRTSATPGRWLTVGPVLRLWELSAVPGQLMLGEDPLDARADLGQDLV